MGIDDSDTLKYAIYKSIDEPDLHKRAEKMKYSAPTAEDIQYIREKTGLRNEILATAIEENAAPNRRLIVVSGGLHVFKIDKTAHSRKKLRK